MVPDCQLVFKSFPGWDSTGMVWRKVAPYNPAYSPPARDAASNFAHEVYLANNPDVPLPYAKLCVSAHEYLEDMTDWAAGSDTPTFVIDECDLPY